MGEEVVTVGRGQESSIFLDDVTVSQEARRDRARRRRLQDPGRRQPQRHLRQPGQGGRRGPAKRGRDTGRQVPVQVRVLLRRAQQRGWRQGWRTTAYDQRWRATRAARGMPRPKGTADKGQLHHRRGRRAPQARVPDALGEQDPLPRAPAPDQPEPHPRRVQALLHPGHRAPAVHPDPPGQGVPPPQGHQEAHRGRAPRSTGGDSAGDLSRVLEDRTYTREELADTLETEIALRGRAGEPSA